MKTFKGTKGNWFIQNGYLTTDEINKDNRCPIATIHTMEDGKDNVKRQAEAEANDKLIASAPELLEALNNLCESFDKDGLSKHQLESYWKAKEAINKAL